MQWNEFRVHIRHFTAREIERVRGAFELGAEAHGNQTRRSGEPYFTHPITVAHVLADMGADPETIMAALLHDTVEDTDLKLPEIEKRFGPVVAGLIEGVTKLSQEDVRDRPSLNEQIETLRKMFRLMERDIRIMVIKLVDRLHNMQTAQFLSPEKRKALAKETQEIYVRIADRLCMQDLRDELESLTLPILEPDLFEQMSRKRQESEQRADAVLGHMQARLGTQGETGLSELHFEPKSWENLRRQVETIGDAVTGVSTFTVVLTCQSVADCYRVLGALHQTWRREVLSFQDFINSPAVNGYRGLHTTIILEEGTRVRCKIRTDEMQEYARKGVAAICFKPNPGELAANLPWTARISTLADDAEERSQEFWQSLQSDILGESFIIHGTGDETISVPKESTALDGAFYLFRDSALRCETIHVDGKEVPFGSPLTHGASMSLTLAEKPTVKLSWLSQVKTGFAAAAIRTALSRSLTQEEKERLGKSMLQEAFQQQRKGFIEEFDERSLQQNIQRLGYTNLPELYIAIADGRTDPRVATTTLFENGKNPERIVSPETVLYTYKANMNDPVTLDRLYEIYKRYLTGIVDMRILHISDREGSELSMNVNLPAEEQQRLIGELEKAGVQTIRKRGSRLMLTYALAVGFLVALWGLDPVLARLLVRNTASPIDLTVIRFLAFFVFSAIVFARQRFFNPQRYKPLSPFQPTLIGSSIALFFTGIFTYFTLEALTATQYILVILSGLSVVRVLRDIREDRLSWIDLLTFASVSVATFFALKMQRPPGLSILMAIGSSLCFALYSLLSKRFQDEVGFVRERYPAFLFWISFGCLLFSLPLLNWMNLHLITTSGLLATVFFALVFAVLPYALYFECMRRIPMRYLDATLPFVVISTVIGDIALGSGLSWLSALPLVAILPWQILEEFARGKRF